MFVCVTRSPRPLKCCWTVGATSCGGCGGYSIIRYVCLCLYICVSPLAYSGCLLFLFCNVQARVPSHACYPDTYACTRIHTHKRTCAYTNTHTQVQTHKHTHTHTHTDTHKLAHTHTHTHTNIHVHRHTGTHTHTHTHSGVAT